MNALFHTVRAVPSLLMMCRGAVIKLIRTGHQLEQSDLPVSLQRFIHLLAIMNGCHNNI